MSNTKLKLLYDPESSSVFKNKGLSLYKLGKYDEAIAFFDKSIQKDPTNCQTFKYKGEALSKLKKYNEAIETFKKAIDCNKLDADSHFEIGLILFENKQYEESIIEYDTAIEIQKDPQKLSKIHCCKADSLFKLIRYEEAAEFYARSIRDQPSDGYSHKKRGICLYKIKMYEEAIKCFDQAVLVFLHLEYLLRFYDNLLCIKEVNPTK